MHQSGLQLRNIQVAALDAIVAQHVMGIRRMLVVLPTGAGKTVLFANVPRLLHGRVDSGTVRSRVGRVLILAHRRELLVQAERTFRLWEPRATVQVFAGGRLPNLSGLHVLIASVQSISQRSTLASIPRDAFGLITIDEAHHATLDSAYMRVVDHFGGRTTTGARVHGYTATPHRADGETLNHLFDTIAFSCTLADGMRQGWLCDTRYRAVRISADLLTAATDGDFNEGQLASLMDREEVTCTVIGAYLNVRDEVRRWGMSPRAIGFAVNRIHAAHVVTALRAVDISAEYIGGDLATDERRRLVRAFRAGHFEVLVSVDLLLEGFDDDGINIALDLKPTRSNVLATQEFGRIVRKCVVSDTTTNRIQDLKPRAVYVQALPEHATEAGMFTVPDVLGFHMNWADERAVAALERMPLGEAAEHLDVAVAMRGAIGRLLGDRGGSSPILPMAALEDPTGSEKDESEWTDEERRQWILQAFAAAPQEIVQLVYALPAEFEGSDFRWQTHLDKSIDLPLGRAGSLRILSRDLLGRYALQRIDVQGRKELISMHDRLDIGRHAAERLAVRDYPEAGRLYRKSLAETWMRRPASPAALRRVRDLYPSIRPETVGRLTAGVASELIRLANHQPMLEREMVA